MSEQDQMDFESYVSKHIVPKASKAAGACVLLLQCMDFRYPHRTIQTMDNLGLRGKYYQLILAGASLGVTQGIDKEAWQTTFLDQLGFAMGEKPDPNFEVYILDHRDCAAYKKLLNPPVTPDDPKKEKEAHTRYCQLAVTVIVEAYPSLKGKVECLLLPIETVEPLSIVWP